MTAPPSSPPRWSARGSLPRSSRPATPACSSSRRDGDGGHHPPRLGLAPVRRGDRHSRATAGDLRPGAEWAWQPGARRGRRLHRLGLLLHQLDQLRKPGDRLASWPCRRSHSSGPSRKRMRSSVPFRFWEISRSELTSAMIESPTPSPPGPWSLNPRPWSITWISLNSSDCVGGPSASPRDFVFRVGVISFGGQPSLPSPWLRAHAWSPPGRSDASRQPGRPLRSRGPGRRGID